MAALSPPSPGAGCEQGRARLLMLLVSVPYSRPPALAHGDP